MSIKGFKVFNPDWTCRGFQYKVGETFVHNGNIEMCGAGFHFCQKASDCFNYYNFNSQNKVAEVEALGLVETQEDKSVTDKIKIIREIEWSELLTIVNDGKNCTGLGNTGDWNTGDWNTGSRNTGDWNTGDWNTGDWNTGSRNTGSRNTGDWNTGDWNSTNYSTGFFNSVEQNIFLFNKPTSMSRDEIHSLKGIQILNWNFENSWWIYSVNMSDDEKKSNPKYETTGGYLKTVDFKTACKMMWENLSENERQEVMKLPNFDSNIFYEITGIIISK
nr:MAG TPA: PPE-repeat protein [Caudoviricetes sp.]